MLSLGGTELLLAAETMPGWLYNTLMFVKVLIGFSVIIFVHELGHFLAAKWVGIRVDRFSIGFGTRLFGYRKGEGFTFGNRPEYSAVRFMDEQSREVERPEVRLDVEVDLAGGVGEIQIDTRPTKERPRRSRTGLEDRLVGYRVFTKHDA